MMLHCVLNFIKQGGRTVAQKCHFDVISHNIDAFVDNSLL